MNSGDAGSPGPDQAGQMSASDGLTPERPSRHSVPPPLDELAGVGACIVAWQPAAATLLPLLSLLLSQLEHVVVVDNGGAAALLAANELPQAAAEPAARLTAGQRARLMLLTPGSNLGVAGGHNLGMQRLFALGCQHAVLFDQDSLPRPDMLAVLMRTERRLLAGGLPVAAVGPRHRPAADAAPAPFVRLQAGCVQLLRTADPQLPAAACRCDFLITSGCLLRREVVERVGALDDSLFIDNVDVEWCYRAAAHGFHCYGAMEADMQHSLGDRQLTLPLLGRALVIHPPLRIYYMMRNRWRLYAMPHVPLAWKLADIPRMLAKQLIFSLGVSPRRRYLHAGLAGLRDGLLRRGGAAPQHF